MAIKKKHSVKANLQIFSLSKAGTSLELEVFEQQTRTKRRKIGTVIIGRGSLTWVKEKVGLVSECLGHVLRRL